MGDVRAVLATLPACSVDLVVTSPPFLLQREYLPMDHELKDCEIGRETHPADYIDALLAVVADIDRVLKAEASIAFELGDTHSGSGGAGGDYNVGGWREGQPKYKGSGSAARPGGGFRPNHGAEVHGMWSPKKRTLNPPPTWPMAKSLALVPELFRVALAYGRNPLTGADSPAGRWIIRNVVRWVKTNPSPGDDGDKYRRATSDIVVATRNPRRYFDDDSVRVPGVEPGTTRPLFDWWQITNSGYDDAHFATFPPALVVPLIISMCPPGGTVLDPFGGSGTVGAVATGQGRDAILIDIDERNVKMAADRIGMFGEFYRHVDVPLGFATIPVRVAT